MMQNAGDDDAFNFKADTTVPVGPPGEGTPELQPNKTKNSFMDDFVTGPVDAVRPPSNVPCSPAALTLLL